MPVESPPAGSGRFPPRLVCFVSDSTGITAETLGTALLVNFPSVPFEKCAFPFVDTVAEAEVVVRAVNDATGPVPIVFTTVRAPAVRAVLDTANAMIVDLLSGHLTDLERMLGTTASAQLGQYHAVGDMEHYFARMRAVEYALEHDDVQSRRALDAADVLIIGPSRCGKTPTTMYLALQYGLRVANYPLTDDDFESEWLPVTVAPHRVRCFGLTTSPRRLSQIRHERRPDSRYASLEQCTYEVRRAEELYRRFEIPFLNTATRSVEEMAAVILTWLQRRDAARRETRNRMPKGILSEGVRT